MNSLFIFSILFVTISGLPLSSQFLKDPFSFISTNEEGGKEQLYEMVAQLRSDNTATMAKATSLLDSAISAKDEATAALEAAQAAEELALGNVVEQEILVANLAVVAKEATAVEADANTKKQSAQDASDQANNFFDSETDRINEEKATLEEVLELISSLEASALNEVSNNRNLLSIVDLSSLANADPASVAEVKQLLDDLIAVGESEREAADAAATVATNNLEAATSVHNGTWHALAQALGELDFHTEGLADMRGVAEGAVAAKNAALAAFNAAVQALNNSQSHFDTESSRVENEEAIFVQVTALLDTLS